MAKACSRWPASIPAAVVIRGILKFIEQYAPDLSIARICPPVVRPPRSDQRLPVFDADGQFTRGPPSFCTGCPERPIFTAMKLVERELGTASRQL